MNIVKADVEIKRSGRIVNGEDVREGILAVLKNKNPSELLILSFYFIRYCPMANQFTVWKFFPLTFVRRSFD